MSIRTFHNADLPDLTRIWNQHFGAIGYDSQVTNAQFEQAVLSRTFFHAEQLLIAEADGQPTAWAHLQPASADGLPSTLSAVCVSWDCPDDLVQELIRETVQRVPPNAGSEIQAGISDPASAGYAGLTPTGPGIGIPTSDTRVNSCLESAGFQKQTSRVRLQASVTGFRPPVNRAAMQLRRSSRVAQRTTYPESARMARSMSHLDIANFQLIDRTDEQLASIDFWLGDPEAEVMQPTAAILDLQNLAALEATETYLLCNAIQALGQQRIGFIETVVDPERAALIASLEALGFQKFDEGAVWRKVN